MMKVHLSARERFLSTLTSSMAALAILYAGIYLPLHRQSMDVQEQIEVSERQLQKTIRTIHRGKFSEQEYQTILEYFKQTSSDEQEMSSMLAQIEAIARGINIRIVDMKPRRPRGFDLYNQFFINLEIDGELVSITEFIHNLQNPPYFFHIDELRLNKVSPQMAGLKCQVTFSKILIR